MKNKRLLIAVGLVLLPLVDSLFIPQAFAIQWHSPEFMYLVSVALLAIKFVMVLVGGWLLLAKDLSSEPSKAVRLTRFGTFLLAGLQLVIMSAILLWYAVAGTQAKHFQQQGPIAVFTADYGIFKAVHHQFSYVCVDDNGFYNQQAIANLQWLGRFSFQQVGSLLVIKHSDQKGEHIKEIDLTGYQCGR